MEGYVRNKRNYANFVKIKDGLINACRLFVLVKNLNRNTVFNSVFLFVKGQNKNSLLSYEKS